MAGCYFRLRGRPILGRGSLVDCAAAVGQEVRTLDQSDVVITEIQPASVTGLGFSGVNHIVPDRTESQEQPVNDGFYLNSCTVRLGDRRFSREIGSSVWEVPHVHGPHEAGLF